MSKRRKFSPAFKSQVVLEVLTGTKTAAQICREYGLKDSVLSRWKRDFIERAPQLFEGDAASEQFEAKVAELERMVGRLSMELEVAKIASLYLMNSPSHGSER